MICYILRILSVLCKCCVLVVLFYAAQEVNVAAEVPGNEPYEIPEPKVCIGFNPASSRWGAPTFQGTNADELYCPQGYAIFAHHHVAGSWRTKPSSFPLEGNCCPLPSGVLTDKHIFVREECPELAVVTGSRFNASNSDSATAPKFELRCTEINTSKYVLGPKLSGWTIGWDSELFPELLARLGGASIHRIAWSSIPAGIRYGILRTGFGSWEESGCVGYPWGSVLVARTGNKCHSMHFRQIHQKDALSGEIAEALIVVPSCRAITSRFDPNATCAIDSIPSEEPRAVAMPAAK